MSYAEEDAEGIKLVMLCRVCCGEVYYTEEETLPDGEERAMGNQKHSILANPQWGEREFIAFENAQVYPEFILEIKSDATTQPTAATLC